MQSFQLSLLVTLFCLLITGCSQKEKSASGEPAKPLSDAQPSPPPSADSNKAPIENKKAFVTRQLQKLAEGETLQLSYPE
ncbi:MAG: hypothetical protein NTV34_08320, partial [Proteobacteria bacterium]|nr:hypothetical protein [Pseudomonadota bacterium]